MAISLIKDMDKETVLRVLLTMLEISYHSQKRGEGYSAGLFLRYAHETALLSPVCPPNLRYVINKAFVSMKERKFKETSMYIGLAYHLIQRLEDGRAPLPIDDYDLSEGGVYFPGGDDEVNENKMKDMIDSILTEAEECNDKTGGKYRGYSINPNLKRINNKNELSGHEWSEYEQISGFAIHGPKILPKTEFKTVKKAKEYIDWFIKFKLNEALLEADYMDNANPNNNATDQGTITPPDMDAQTQEVPNEKNPENKPEDEEPKEDEETEEEPEEKSEVRLLVIDKIPCNRQLKELTKDPMAEFPLTAVEAALDEINIAIEPGEKEGFHLDGETGNIDLELIEKSSGKFINNSFLIVYWSTIEGSTNFNFNCYLG
jgi:hypothetical protein